MVQTVKHSVSIILSFLVLRRRETKLTKSIHLNRTKIFFESVNWCTLFPQATMTVALKAVTKCRVEADHNLSDRIET